MATLDYTVINAGAESATVGEGWTNVLGTLTRAGSSYAHSGNYTHAAGSVASTECYQDIAVDATDLPAIALGTRKISLDWWQGGYENKDLGKLSLQFYDATDTYISEFTEALSSSANSMTAKSHRGTIPLGTTRFRIRMQGTRVSGTELSYYVDDIRLRSYDEGEIPPIAVSALLSEVIVTRGNNPVPLGVSTLIGEVIVTRGKNPVPLGVSYLMAEVMVTDVITQPLMNIHSYLKAPSVVLLTESGGILTTESGDILQGA